MVLKRFLASVGIGNTSVDTVLRNSVLIPGDFLHGVINLRGGSVDQLIDRIDLVLESVAEREGSETDTRHTVKIMQYNLLERFTIGAGMMKEVPFQVPVPHDAPITRIQGLDLRIPLYLRTEVEVAGAINPSDRDRVEIEPNRAQMRILEAMANLGFRLYKADLEFGQVRNSRLPFFQEIEFKAGPNFSRQVNEVEVTFVTREQDMDVILEIDKKSQGWARLAYDSIDQVRGFTVRYNDLQQQNWERVIEGILLR